MSRTLKTEIAILGAGISGLLTARALRERGQKQLLIIPIGESRRRGSTQPGVGIVGAWDNYSRILQSHGPTVGKAFWGATQVGFQELLQALTALKVPFSKGDRWRFFLSPEEAEEGREAIAALHRDGWAGKWSDQPMGLTPAGVAGGQLEAGSAVVFDHETFLKQLCNALPKDLRIQSPLSAVEQDASGVRLLCGELEIHAEMAVFATHEYTRELMRTLHDVIIPVIEQWSLFRCDPCPWPVGTVWSAFHSHHTGFVCDAKHVMLGGGRFLRPLAGVDQCDMGVFPKSLDFTQKTFLNLAGAQTALTLEQTYLGIEVRPCDEFPIVGPMFGESRLWLTTGYLNNGFVFAAYAAKVLSELILRGASPDYIPMLGPRRFRSLED